MLGQLLYVDTQWDRSLLPWIHSGGGDDRCFSVGSGCCSVCWVNALNRSASGLVIELMALIGQICSTALAKIGFNACCVSY